jgi:hypothetical protein
VAMPTAAATISTTANVTTRAEPRDRLTMRQPCEIIFLTQVKAAVHAFRMKKP